MAQLLLTLIGDDREGLVASLSQAVLAHGGNWQESQMARLGGKFAGIALVDLPDAKAHAFTAAVGALDGLDVTVTPAGEDVGAVGLPVTLHLVGNDHTGIVSEVTTALASRAISIDEMHTFTRPAPMGDTMLFEAVAQVRLPKSVELEGLRDALESIAHELMVDLEVDETLED